MNTSIADIMSQIRRELVFKDNFKVLADKMFRHIMDYEGGKNKNLIFVGIHARRGDRITVWKQRQVIFDWSLVKNCGCI